MTDFLLVHGAWHGGWCWRLVANGLRAAGHRVLTPTLTGQGERLHLLDASVGLDTHVQDVLAVLENEELSDVVLVGHSYGARPTVLATAHPAVRHWVSLDGVAVIPGLALLHGLPEPALAAARAQLVDGVGSPPLAAAAIGVPADHPHHDWVERRMTAMAWKAFEDPLPPWPARFASLPRTYVEALGNEMEGVRAGLAQARAEGWPLVSIDSGHDLMVTAPDAVVAVLLEIAG
jgi:pimeloyl-ACP methyl ester carboxylesterase